MKRIIALRHSSNKGKTGTLIELGNLLLSESRHPPVYIRINGFDDTSACKSTHTLPEDHDFSLVVELSGKTIGIESQGDPNSELKDRLLKMIDEYEVDYLFCTTRTKGETISDVYDAANSKSYEILWTSTYYSDDSENKELCRKLNRWKARHLLDLLKELTDESK